MLSGVCIVFRLTADCCHATLFHPARTFTAVCSFNPIKSHKIRTATNGRMLAQCLTIRIKIQICNLRNGVFLTSWLTRVLFRIHHCSEECLRRVLTYVMKQVKVLRDLRRSRFAKYRSVICETEYIWPLGLAAFCSEFTIAARNI